VVNKWPFAETPKYLVMSFFVALLALPQNVKIQLLHNLHYVTVLVKGERRGTVGKFNSVFTLKDLKLLSFSDVEIA